MSDNVSTLTADTFDEVIGGPTPVLVDFWAEWCAPCRQVAPILDELSTSHADRLRIAKIDVDANQEIPQRFAIMSIPTMILFVGGQEKLRLVGSRGKEQLLRELEPHLG